MKKWTKAAYHTANILLPLSESARMVRAGRHVASRLTEQTRQLMPVKDDLTDAPELTFDEAVTASGLSREVLMRRYLLGKRIWLAMFIVTVAIMLIMPLAFIASDIPATGMLLIRMASLEFMLAAFASLVFACALKNQYRFWQLQSSHLGTFAEWRSSRSWVIEILSWR